MLTHLQAERFAPALFAGVCAFGWWRLGLGIPDQFAKELLGALISSAAICAGFLTTAMAILLPMGDTAVGRRLKRRGKLPYLYGYLRAAIYSCLFVVAVCLAAFFQLKPEVGITGAVAWIVAGACAYCAAAMVRVVEIIIKIMIGMADASDADG